MTPLPVRQHYLEIIEEAVASGARKTQACKVAEISVRTIQRWGTLSEVTPDKRPLTVRPVPKNKLSADERKNVLAVCNTEEFSSMPPCQIVPELADRGEYIASESTIYRILNAEDQLHHRGRDKPKGSVKKPASHTATGPNEVWSWDISYLNSQVQGIFFYLYMIEDIFSRKIVGWEVHAVESGDHASELLQRSVLAERCLKTQLVLHSDNGSPMKSLTMQAKMHELGVLASRSRPGVSNDNPYSESLFRTVKYCPRWPSEGFKSLQEARVWVGQFVQWYNKQHKHSRINFVTPEQRHRGEDTAILENRHSLYQKKRSENPERWSSDTRNWAPVGSVELNPENREVKSTTAEAA